MQDSAHDREHVYRVLYTALDIAAHEPGADADVLIAACLLHDVGRAEQFRDPQADHAQVGAEKALRFLRDEGWGEGLRPARRRLHPHAPLPLRRAAREPGGQDPL